jgi:hypothetical protein
VTDKIVQANITGHTGASAAHRLGSPARFDGPVEPGGEYILVDDMVTSGSTLNGLRLHIENGGGKVVGVTTLAATSHPQTGYAGQLAVTPETLARLRKFDKVGLESLLREHEIAPSIEDLTNSQGRHIATFKDVDTLRNRLAAAGRARNRPEGAGAFAARSAGQTGQVLAQPDTPPGQQPLFQREEKEWTPDERAARGALLALVRKTSNMQPGPKVGLATDPTVREAAEVQAITDRLPKPDAVRYEQVAAQARAASRRLRGLPVADQTKVLTAWLRGEDAHVRGRDFLFQRGEAGAGPERQRYEIREKDGRLWTWDTVADKPYKPGSTIWSGGTDAASRERLQNNIVCRPASRESAPVLLPSAPGSGVPATR